METKIKWNNGEGYITATYEGSGDSLTYISSDINEGIHREQSIKVETTDKNISHNILITQDGLRQRFVTSDNLVFCVPEGRFGVLKN